MQQEYHHYGTIHDEATEKAAMKRDILHDGKISTMNEFEQMSRVETPTEVRPLNQTPPIEDNVNIADASQGPTEASVTQGDAYAQPAQPETAPHRRVAELRGSTKKRSSTKKSSKKPPTRSAYDFRSGYKEVRQS